MAFVFESARGDSAPSVIDLEALGAGLLETSSSGLMIDESVPRLLATLAVLAKDVWLDSGARDVDTGSVELCKEPWLETVRMMEGSNLEESDGVPLRFGKAPVPSESGKSTTPNDLEKVEAVCTGVLEEDTATLDRGWVNDGVVVEAAIPGGVIDRDTIFGLTEKAGRLEESAELGEAELIGVVCMN